MRQELRVARKTAGEASLPTRWRGNGKAAVGGTSQVRSFEMGQVLAQRARKELPTMHSTVRGLVTETSPHSGGRCDERQRWVVQGRSFLIRHLGSARQVSMKLVNVRLLERFGLLQVNRGRRSGFGWYRSLRVQELHTAGKT